MRKSRVRLESLETRTLFALTPVGAELLVNTSTAGDQYAPAIASNLNGNFVVVWVGDDGDGNGIRARRYNFVGTALGSEFAVNTITTGSQSQPAIVMDNGGNFVVTWNSNGDVMSRRFNSAGGGLDVTEFLVNTYTTGNQDSPDIAIDASGDFVIAWDSQGQDGSSFGVYARRYDPAGTALDGSEFLVNQTTADLQADPSVAMDGNGNFVITWNSGSLSGIAKYDIYARLYNAAGVPQLNEFQVNTFTTDYQVFPAVAMDADGDFVIAWQSFQQEGPGFGYGVYARRYDSAAAPVSGELAVNTFTVNNQTDVAIDMSAPGVFTIAWTSAGQDGSGKGVYARGYDVAGNSFGPPTRINATTAGDQSRPAIALRLNGLATIAWQDDSADGSGFGIFAQRFGSVQVSSSGYDVDTKNVGITFSEDVSQSLDMPDILVQQIVSNTLVTIPSSSMLLNYNPSTRFAELSFGPGYPAGLLPDGNYRITLAANGIFDFAGNQLDGDQNGLPGGNHVFDFFVYSGDANHDRNVNVADLTILAANWQGFPRTFSQGDFNYDQTVDIYDLRILATRYGQSLSPPVIATPLSVAMPPTRRPVRVAVSVLS